MEIAASSPSPKLVEIEGPASSVLTVIARSVGAVIPIDGAAFRLLHNVKSGQKIRPLHQ